MTSLALAYLSEKILLWSSLHTFFCANFPLKPPLMDPRLLSFLENSSPFNSWFHFLLMQLSCCVWCKEWSDCQLKIFGVLAWLLNATLSESQKTHSLAAAQAAQSDTRVPKESLKTCSCCPAGLSEARSRAHCITDVIPAPFSLADVPGWWLQEQHSHLELNLGDR